MVPSLTKRRMLKEMQVLKYAERMKRFSSLMENSLKMMSEDGYYNFLKRTLHKNPDSFEHPVWLAPLVFWYDTLLNLGDFRT